MRGRSYIWLRNGMANEQFAINVAACDKKLTLWLYVFALILSEPDDDAIPFLNAFALQLKLPKPEHQINRSHIEPGRRQDGNRKYTRIPPMTIMGIIE